VKNEWKNNSEHFHWIPYQLPYYRFNCLYNMHERSPFTLPRLRREFLCQGERVGTSRTQSHTTNLLILFRKSLSRRAKGRTSPNNTSPAVGSILSILFLHERHITSTSSGASTLIRRNVIVGHQSKYRNSFHESIRHKNNKSSVMSKLIVSPAVHEHRSRPLSASAMHDSSTNQARESMREARKRQRSLSADNTSNSEILRDSLSTAAGLSPSFDEESGLAISDKQKLVSTPKLRKISSKGFDKESSKAMDVVSSKPSPPSHSKDKQKTKKDQSAERSTPLIKLKPRRHRNSSFSSSSSSSSSSKILHFNSPCDSPKGTKASPMGQPPLIPQFFTTPDRSKIREQPMPSPPKRAKLTTPPTQSTPQEKSPPQLIPTFDYGIGATTNRNEDSITPPPQIRPRLPSKDMFMTPLLSLQTPTKEPVSKEFSFTLSSDPVAAFAKPIARRPLITPSNRLRSISCSNENSPNRLLSSSNNSNDRSKNATSMFWVDDCTPMRLFQPNITDTNVANNILPAPLSSSMECSAFSNASQSMNIESPPTKAAITVTRGISDAKYRGK